MARVSEYLANQPFMKKQEWRPEGKAPPSAATMRREPAVGTMPPSPRILQGWFSACISAPYRASVPVGYDSSARPLILLLMS
jgi:hypothetical protein